MLVILKPSGSEHAQPIHGRGRGPDAHFKILNAIFLGNFTSGFRGYLSCERCTLRNL